MFLKKVAKALSPAYRFARRRQHGKRAEHKEKKAFKKENAGIEREFATEEERHRPLIQKRAEEEKQARHTGFEEGRKRTEEFINRDVQGLTPEHRRAIQGGAIKNIKRNMQGANRRLLAQQGARGIRGGAAYAQQADLQRAENDARGQTERDITQLDADMKLRKLATQFAGAQGEAAQSSMDRQVAADELKLNEERKRQRQIEARANRLFNRV